MTQYANNLSLAQPPDFLLIGDMLCAWDALTPQQRAEQGWLPLVYDRDEAPMGYADPVQETRDGQAVAVAYALGTPEERATKTLADAKDRAHTLRRAERDRRQTSIFPYDGHRYDCDRDSILRIGQAVSAADRAMAMGHLEYWSAGSGWRDTEGTPRIVTGEQMIALDGALIAWGLACDVASQIIAQEIDNAVTVELLDSIIADIPTDPRWPE